MIISGEGSCGWIRALPRLLATLLTTTSRGGLLLYSVRGSTRCSAACGFGEGKKVNAFPCTPNMHGICGWGSDAGWK